MREGMEDKRRDEWTQNAVRVTLTESCRVRIVT